MQNDIVKQPKPQEQENGVQPTPAQSSSDSGDKGVVGTTAQQPAVSDPDFKPSKKDKKKKKRPDVPLEPQDAKAQPGAKSKNGVGAVVSVAVVICLVLVGVAVYSQM